MLYIHQSDQERSLAQIRWEPIRQGKRQKRKESHLCFVGGIYIWVSTEPMPILVGPWVPRFLSLVQCKHLHSEKWIDQVPLSYLSPGRIHKAGIPSLLFLGGGIWSGSLAVSRPHLICTLSHTQKSLSPIVHWLEQSPLAEGIKILELQSLKQESS